MSLKEKVAVIEPEDAASIVLTTACTQRAYVRIVLHKEHTSAVLPNTMPQGKGTCPVSPCLAREKAPGYNSLQNADCTALAQQQRLVATIN